MSLRLAVLSGNAGLHRASRDKYRRDIEPHRSHQHSRGNLVAIADAYHGIGLVGIYHIFHAVGNDVAGRQGIEHSVVAHCNAIVHCNRIEFSGIAAERLDFRLHNLSDFVEMCVAGHKLGE